jgi:PhzF family phenazine biosynthesis protein
MQLSFATLDVFTSTPYFGNPVAIVKLPTTTSLKQEQKQLVAREFNLSETVFLHEQTPEDADNGIVRIDIFTPWTEIPFAGHPTVGTSNYLLRDLNARNFKTLVMKAGKIPVRLSDDGKAIQLEVVHNVHVHDQPFRGEYFGHFPVVSIVKGMTFILAKIENLEELSRQNKSYRDDSYNCLDALDEGWQVGLCATYFYVDLGVDESGVRQLRTRCQSMREDPATGSAASALCSYLSLSENPGAMACKYKVTQGVEMGRKSEIGVEVTTKDDRNAIEKVVLSGTAVKVMEGLIEVPG